MYFYLIGIDYRNAPIDVREYFYRERKTIADFWKDYNPYGSAILVTCNRLEIYGLAKHADEAFVHIRNFSHNFPYFFKYAYLKYTEKEILRHALSLAVGLESQIKGEPQILQQLKAWRLNSRLPDSLQDLWDKVIPLAEKLRIASQLNQDGDNLATLIYAELKNKPGLKDKYKVIVIGTGKIAELFVKYRPPKVEFTFIAHKNYQKAKTLAEKANGMALPLHNLPEAIAEADVLIGATTSPHYILKKNHFSQALSLGKHPLYIYDLALPRDIEPEVGDIEGIFLQNLDDLNEILSLANQSKKENIKLASDLIESLLGTYQEIVCEGLLK